jgi:hypothetical protein
MPLCDLAAAHGHDQSYCSKANGASDYCADNVGRGYPMLDPQFLYTHGPLLNTLSSPQTQHRQPALKIVAVTPTRVCSLADGHVEPEPPGVGKR